jgi:hypothetical protein
MCYGKDEFVADLKGFLSTDYEAVVIASLEFALVHGTDADCSFDVFSLI